MVRLRAQGSNTESGVPYTDEEINAMARKGKQRGHLPGVGRVLPGRAKDVLILPPPPPPQCTHNSDDVKKLKKKNKYLTKQCGLSPQPSRVHNRAESTTAKKVELLENFVLFLLYSYEYVFNHIFGELRGNALPHDLADSDDEDLVNVEDDDGVKVMSADVARGHGGDGGGDDRPPSHHIPTGCGGCFANRGKGTRKANLGGRKAGRLHTRQETRNLGLKKITDDKGPVPIRFEWDDKKTMMPLGDHASHWSNYLGELIREMPLYYPSWQKVPAVRKAAIMTRIGIQFDLTPHMQSQRWADINAGIQQHLQKLYNTNKASLKAAHWVINPETGTNQARAAQNRQNWAKSTVVCRQGSRSLARLRDQMMESSANREYPSLIYTFFVTHTVNGVFTRDEDRALYEDMLMLQVLGSNTPSGVPYTDEEINALAQKGNQRGHLPGVGRVLPGRATNVLIPSTPEFAAGSGGCEDDERATMGRR
ncbi:hypothetical protein Tco_1304187 [Tanacetum coccineum]